MDPALVFVLALAGCLLLFGAGWVSGKLVAEADVVSSYQPSLPMGSTGTETTVTQTDTGLPVKWSDAAVRVDLEQPRDVVYGEPPREPYSDECTDHVKVGANGLALWYPQMGGYSGRAVALRDEAGHYDVWVWHDGAFPFSSIPDALDPTASVDLRSPVCIHHCDPQQFIEFGTTLRDLLGEPS